MTLTRRTFAKRIAAALSAPLVFTGKSWGFTNEPHGSEAVFGINTPQTGPYADEGADQLRAFELAVEHLNGGGDGGMLNTFSSKSLQGNGVLGRKVSYVTGDTQTRQDAARASAKSMIEKDGAIMLTGGVSSGVAIATQSLCQEAGILFMAGAAHSANVTGRDKKRNAFRHYFNSEISSAILAEGLAEELGSERRYFQLTADYGWGYEQEGLMTQHLEFQGWTAVGSQQTPLSTNDFSPYLSPFLNSGADVLVLNHFGGNLVNSLTNAVQYGVRDRQANGKSIEIVAPVMTRLMASGAGQNAQGVYSTSNWLWSDADTGTQSFVRSFANKYGFPPSESAHTVYCQTLLYADACQRAGSFQPSAVGEALEDFEWDGLGNGPSIFDAADHQAYMDVFMVQGNGAPSSEYDLLVKKKKKKPCPKSGYCPRPDGIVVPDFGAFNDGY